MVRSYVVTAPTPQRVAAFARRMAPAVFFLVLAGGGALVADWADPFGRSFALGGIAVISVFVALTPGRHNGDARRELPERGAKVGTVVIGSPASN
jgi:hypothetical protein